MQQVKVFAQVHEPIVTRNGWDTGRTRVRIIQAAMLAEKWERERRRLEDEGCIVEATVKPCA